jgi:hypothetical protein
LGRPLTRHDELARTGSLFPQNPSTITSLVPRSGGISSLPCGDWSDPAQLRPHLAGFDIASLGKDHSFPASPEQTPHCSHPSSTRWNSRRSPTNSHFRRGLAAPPIAAIFRSNARRASSFREAGSRQSKSRAGDTSEEISGTRNRPTQQDYRSPSPPDTRTLTRPKSRHVENHRTIGERLGFGCCSYFSRLLFS